MVAPSAAPSGPSAEELAYSAEVPDALQVRAVEPVLDELPALGAEPVQDARPVAPEQDAAALDALPVAWAPAAAQVRGALPVAWALAAAVQALLVAPAE